MSENNESNENTGQTVDTAEIAEYVGDTGGQTNSEDQARSLGWKPEAEFTGDPSKWTDADSFLEVHSRNNGALRKANDKLNSEIAALKQKVGNQEIVSTKLLELQIKKAKNEFDNQIAFLKAQKKEALSTGNHELAAEMDEQLTDAKERGPDLSEVPELPKNQEITPANDWKDNPFLVQTVEKNPWIETDEDASTFVIAKTKQILERLGRKPTASEFETAVSDSIAATKKAFPQKFGATTRRSPVEGSTTGVGDSSSNRTQTYNAMPREARDMCDDMVRDKIVTREDYVKQYFTYETVAKRSAR